MNVEHPEQAAQELSQKGNNNHHENSDVVVALQPQQQQPEGWSIQENIQIGMVRTYTLNPQANDLSMAGNFLNYKANSGPLEKEQISIPKKWASFFEGLLKSPTHHAWAKNLLQLGFPEMLRSGPTNDCMISIKKQLTTDTCSLLNDEPSLVKEIEDNLPDQSYEETTASKKRGRKAKASTPVVDSAVRRSIRIQYHSKGFKKESCAKNCLACSSQPPTLSSATISKIGASLCQVTDSELEEMHNQSKGYTQPIGKKLKKNKDDKEDENDKEDNNNQEDN